MPTPTTRHLGAGGAGAPTTRNLLKTVGNAPTTQHLAFCGAAQTCDFPMIIFTVTGTVEKTVDWRVGGGSNFSEDDILTWNLPDDSGISFTHCPRRYRKIDNSAGPTTSKKYTTTTTAGTIPSRCFSFNAGRTSASYATRVTNYQYSMVRFHAWNSTSINQQDGFINRAYFATMVGLTYCANSTSRTTLGAASAKYFRHRLGGIPVYYTTQTTTITPYGTITTTVSKPYIDQWSAGRLFKIRDTFRESTTITITPYSTFHYEDYFTNLRIGQLAAKTGASYPLATLSRPPARWCHNYKTPTGADSWLVHDCFFGDYTDDDGTNYKWQRYNGSSAPPWPRHDWWPATTQTCGRDPTTGS